MKAKTLIAFALAGLVSSMPAIGAVSPEEAKALGTTLTEFGAVKGANADGSIPAYTGGGAKLPAGTPRSNNGRYPNPFKDEKPLYRVDAKNMAQYSDLLTEGTKEMMRRYPSFHAEVYPSHRTMSYPDWVLKNTVKNATTAKLIGKNDGDGVEGAFGGIPFPIPKNGYEVLWNHFLAYMGTSFDIRFTEFLVDSSGKRTLIGDVRQVRFYDYYDQSKTELGDVWYSKSQTSFYGPPSSVGVSVMLWSPSDYSKDDQRSWAYTPGQRRVRLAPESTYDTPSSFVSGAVLAEEQGMYTSRMDRFEMKLIGRKEMLIPYNNYDYNRQPSDQVWTKDHLKSEGQRWEKHRVWVVEGTRRDGARHVYKKRRFYVDEDSWYIVAMDSWDDAGNIYRVGLAYPSMYLDRPGFVVPPLSVNDLVKGNWMYMAWIGDDGTYSRIHDGKPKGTQFTPDSMAGTGIR